MENNKAIQKVSAVQLQTQVESLTNFYTANCNTVKTFEDAIALNKKKGNIIAMIHKGYSCEAIGKVIAKAIYTLQDLLGVKNKMSAEACLICGDDIVNVYWYLNFADISLIFRRARMGKYGKLYERLCEANIMEWFESYCEEKALYGEEKAINEANEYKEMDVNIADKNNLDKVDAKVFYDAFRKVDECCSNDGDKRANIDAEEQRKEINAIYGDSQQQQKNEQ